MSSWCQRRPNDLRGFGCSFARRLQQPIGIDHLSYEGTIFRGQLLDLVQAGPLLDAVPLHCAHVLLVLEDGPVLPVEVGHVAVLLAEALHGDVHQEGGEGEAALHRVLEPGGVDRHVGAVARPARLVPLRAGLAQAHRDPGVGRVVLLRDYLLKLVLGDGSGRRDLVDFAHVDEDLAAGEVARLDADPRLGSDVEGGQEGRVGRGQDRSSGGWRGGEELLRLGVHARRRRQNLETPVQDAAVDLEPGRLEDASIGAAVHVYFYYSLYSLIKAESLYSTTSCL